MGNVDLQECLNNETRLSKSCPFHAYYALSLCLIRPRGFHEVPSRKEHLQLQLLSSAATDVTSAICSRLNPSFSPYQRQFSSCATTISSWDVIVAWAVAGHEGRILSIGNVASGQARASQRMLCKILQVSRTRRGRRFFAFARFSVWPVNDRGFPMEKGTPPPPPPPPPKKKMRTVLPLLKPSTAGHHLPVNQN